MINSQLSLGAYGLIILALIYLFIYLILEYWPKFYKILKSILISLGLALLKNEYISQTISKNRKIINFLKDRFNRQSFWGLPATLFGLSFLYILFLLLGLVEDFINSNSIVALDTRFNQLMLLFRSNYFIKIFLWITSFGHWPTIISLALIFIIILWLSKKKVYILAFCLSLTGSAIMTFLSKLAFHRPRPFYPVYLEKSFSFPSGHATIAVAMYGFIIYFLLHHTKKITQRTLILFFGLIIIIAIGFSRLYLGVHYLSDVGAGYLLGLLWLILGISWTEWQLTKSATQESPKIIQKNNSKIKLVITILILMEVILAIYLANNYNPTKVITTSTAPIMINKTFNLPLKFTLPKFTETIMADKQEPLSFIIASNDKSLINDMRQAGWLLADPINQKSLRQIIKAAWFNSPYPTAPMTPSFWNGKIHTFGFEKPTAKNNISARNHARFWKTNIKTKTGYNIYVGTVSLDTGIKWGITHKIAPAIDSDRDKLFQDLQQAGVIKTFQKTAFVSPTLGENFTGDVFFTDGEIYILILK